MFMSQAKSYMGIECEYQCRFFLTFNLYLPRKMDKDKEVRMDKEVRKSQAKTRK